MSTTSSPIQTENSTSNGFANQITVPKNQKSMDMRFTGSDAATPKANLDTNGPQGPPTRHTTTLNATRPNIMRRISHGPGSLTISTHCKGVLLLQFHVPLSNTGYYRNTPIDMSYQRNMPIGNITSQHNRSRLELAKAPWYRHKLSTKLLPHAMALLFSD